METLAQTIDWFGLAYERVEWAAAGLKDTLYGATVLYWGLTSVRTAELLA